MTKDTFEALIDNILTHADCIAKLNDIGIDLYNSLLVNKYDRIVDLFLKEFFTEEEIEIIYWWCFEVEDKSKPCMWDDNGKVIPMETIEDLWNCINDNDD